MKISLKQLLPENDQFTVMKETDVDLCKYVRWNHVYWGNKLAVGDKIVSQGYGDKKFDNQRMMAFRFVDKETGMLSKDWFGMKEGDLERLLNDETLDYNSQYVYPASPF